MDADPAPSHLSSILIVDDEPDICLALGDLLRHAGYTVRSVMTPKTQLSLKLKSADARRKRGDVVGCREPVLDRNL